MFDYLIITKFTLLKIKLNLSYLLGLPFFLSSIILGSEQCTDDKIITSILTNTVPPHEFIEKNIHTAWMSFMYQPTTNSTILSYLTFQVGETVDIHKIEESLRKLRISRFIWDASYKASEIDSCSVEIEITVIDTFPFKPKLSLSHNNGKSNYSLGVINTNLLGTGAKLQIELKHNRLRNQKIIKYQNPNFGDQHYSFDSSYSNNTDGKELIFNFSRPFHSFETEYAYDIKTRLYQRDVELFDDRKAIFISPIDSRQTSFDFGIKIGEVLNFDYSRFHFYGNQNSSIYSNLSAADYNLNSIGTIYELFDANFIKIKNIRNMSKFEDYNKGLSISFNVGLAYEKYSKTWGDVWGFDYNQSFIINEHSLFLSELHYLRQYLNEITTEIHRRGIFQWNSFSSNFEDSWNIKFTFDDYENPRLENYIIMDEEFPIRGYSYGQFLGDSYASLNIEKRWFNLAHFFNVVDVAAVAFLDTGYISVNDSIITTSHKNWMHSVGLGLRISPTKLSHNTVIHIDLAFPINQRGEQSYQLNIHAKKHF